ncbi:condensation domain-containing protein, partial [Streptomyces aureocirculatus]|uniref:condensation domain-containing protein n=1 Tax=Streptomyces aureocirculatus TaxID=67275 RepID=UPI001CEDCB8C
MSQTQESLWLAQKLAPEVPNAVASRWLIEGPVDAELLCTALRTVFREYAAARVNFRQDGEELRQVVREDDVDAWSPEFHDVSAADDPEAAGRDRAEVIERHPYDLEHDLLFRAGVVRLSASRHLLVLAAHHIVADGYTVLRLLSPRTAACYTALLHGTPVPEAAPGTPELIYEEDLRHRASPQFTQDAAFWRTHLQDAPEAVRIPGERGTGRPAVLHHTVAVPKQDVDAWSEAARAVKVSLPAFLTAASTVFFRHLGGREDFTFSAPALGRTDATRSVYCSQATILPVRVYAPLSMPVADLARSLSEELGQVREHSAFQVTDVRAAAGTADSGSVSGPFGTSLNILPFVAPLDFAGATARLQPGSPWGAIDDLQCAIYYDGRARDDLHVRVDANSTLYSADDTRRFADTLIAFVKAVARDPHAVVGAVDVLGPGERELVLRGGVDATAPTAPMSPGVGGTVGELFARRVAEAPGAVAVVCGEQRFTYAELDARAERLAVELVGRGVGPESVVAVVLPRTADLVAALLG